MIIISYFCFSLQVSINPTRRDGSGLDRLERPARDLATADQAGVNNNNNNNNKNKNKNNNIEDVSNQERKSSPTTKMYEIVKETCGTFEIDNKTISASDLTEPGVVHSDKYLIVGFNFIHYESIPFIEALYRPAFPNILYCPNVPFNATQTVQFKLFQMRFDTGPDSYGAETEDGKVRNLTITLDFFSETKSSIVFNAQYILYDFSTLEMSPMETPFWCVEAAMRHAPKMRGYVYMADDVIFHHWNTKDMNPDKFWWYESIPHKFYDFQLRDGIECFDSEEDGLVVECDYEGERWPWYKRYKKELIAASMLLARHSKLSLGAWNNLKARFGGRTAIPQGWADFYYVPQTYSKRFLHLAELMRSARLWHEMAVATIIFGLTEAHEIEEGDFYYNWNYYTDRDTPWTWYADTQDAVSVHPLKLGLISKKDSNLTSLFCDQIFPITYKNTYVLQ